MSFKLNRLTSINVTNTPQLLFSSVNINRNFYRFSVPNTATSNVLVMALPAGTAAPTQADILAGFDWNVAPGQSVEDGLRESDIWVCLLNVSGTVAIIPKEGIV